MAKRYLLAPSCMGRLSLIRMVFGKNGNTTVKGKESECGSKAHWFLLAVSLVSANHLHHSISQTALNEARHTAKAMSSNYSLFKGLLCEAAATFQCSRCAVEGKSVGPFEKERGQWLLPWLFPSFIIPDCALQRISYPPLPGFLNKLTSAWGNGCGV